MLFAFIRVLSLALGIVLATGGLGGASAQTSTDLVTFVRVDGNQRIEADTVRSYMLIGVGDFFDAGRIDRSLKALYSTGLFADVSIRREANGLVVRVLENPVINRLAFEGNNKLEDDILSAEIQLRPRLTYTRSAVQADVQRIVQVYQRSGRFAATVEPKVIQQPSNRVDLVFEINEGEVTGIRKINFIGNKRFNDGKLRKAISTKEEVWYRFFATDDTYDPDRLTFDRELLRRFYLARGHADFRVLSAVAELNPDREDFFVTFTVEEGELYRFGTIDVVTELKELDPEVVRKVLLTESGEIFNADLIEDTVLALTFEVGRLGFAFVDIRPRTSRNREDKTIDVTFEINEGPKVYVERINISGNIRTIDKVIRREFQLVEGDAYNAARLRRSRQRIQALGFFDNVEISRSEGSAPDQTVIDVEVVERPTGELIFGIGFSTDELLIGEITVRERNLRGRGQDLSASVGLSFDRQEFDISFTEPYFLKRDLSAGFDVFLIRQDFTDFSAFDQRTAGTKFRSSFPLVDFLRLGLSYEIRLDRIKVEDEDASEFIKAAAGSSTTSMVGYSLTYDRRDDRLDPSSGYVGRFSQDFAGLGGSVRFLRSVINFAYYYPWQENWITRFAWEQGHIVGIADDVGLFSRFFIGGDSFRGFETGGIGPRDSATGDALGGTIYYVGTIEQRFPLGLPEELGILGRVFTEVGSLADPDEDGPGFVDTGSVRLSAGVGLSWKSPVGPIALDLAVPLIKEKFDQTELVRFSFGTRF